MLLFLSGLTIGFCICALLVLAEYLWLDHRAPRRSETQTLPIASQIEAQHHPSCNPNCDASGHALL